MDFGKEVRQVKKEWLEKLAVHLQSLEQKCFKGKFFSALLVNIFCTSFEFIL